MRVKNQNQRNFFKEENLNGHSKDISFEHHTSHVPISVETKRNRKTAIIAKSKGIKATERIKTIKTESKTDLSNIKAHYDKRAITVDQDITLTQDKIKDRKANFDANVENDVKQDTSKEASQVNEIDQEIRKDEDNKKEQIKDVELLEEDCPEKPVIDKQKNIINKIFIVTLASLIVYVGYSLNQDFFEMIVESSRAALVLSVFAAVLDSFIAHKIGEQWSKKNKKTTIAYIAIGTLLLSVVFVGQNAAIKLEGEFDDVYNITIYEDNSTKPEEPIPAPITNNDTSIQNRTDLIRAGFICLLFVLSAAAGYEHQKTRSVILPYIELEKRKDKVSKTVDRINENKGKRKVLYEELSAEKRELRTQEIQTLTKQLEALELEKSQLEINRKQDLKARKNLTKLLIDDVRKIYTNN